MAGAGQLGRSDAIGIVVAAFAGAMTDLCFPKGVGATGPWRMMDSDRRTGFNGQVLVQLEL